MELPQDSFQISTEIKTNMRKLFDCFHSSDDIRTREFRLQGVQGAILYLNAATNRDKLQSDVLRPLLESKGGFWRKYFPSWILKSPPI